MTMLTFILCLAIVTFIPRVLPALFIGKLVLPDRVVKYLNYIPYAALGVLIFPGILTAVESPIYGLLGGAFAIVLAYFHVHLFFIVLGSMAFVYGLILVF